MNGPAPTTSRASSRSIRSPCSKATSDVFGDGSVTILSTPGHTPGHQSLLVKLPKTGAIVLSGDAVHFKDNWENRRVPAANFSKEQTLASMQRIVRRAEQRTRRSSGSTTTRPSAMARRWRRSFTSKAISAARRPVAGFGAAGAFRVQRARRNEIPQTRISAKIDHIDLRRRGRPSPQASLSLWRSLIVNPTEFVRAMVAWVSSLMALFCANCAAKGRAKLCVGRRRSHAQQQQRAQRHEAERGGDDQHAASHPVDQEAEQSGAGACAIRAGAPSRPSR